MNILTCEGVTKVYGSGGNRVVALDGIDLAVDRGEFVAVVGASGSGKSTLLHILGSVDKPTGGRVTVEGTDLSELNQTQAAIFRRRKVGLVYQFYNLIPTLTVRKNILMPLTLDKKKPNEAYFEEVVKTLGLSERLEALPNQLSGGQQQRTAIGRAIVKNPDILLCDEPTGALDYHTSKEILKLIEEVNRKYGNTVIMVTHNDAIKNMADRVIKLRDGQIRKNYLNEEKIPASELDW